MQFNAVREILALRSDVNNLGFMNEPELSETTMNLHRPGVAWNAQGSVAVVKAHQIDLETLSKCRETFRVVTIYRDLRDVFVSLDRLTGGLSVDEFIAVAAQRLPLYEAVEALDITLAQRYEDWMSDRRSAQIRQLAEFLGFPLGEDEISGVADRTTVKAARMQMADISPLDRCKVAANRMFQRVPAGMRGWATKIGLTTKIRQYIPAAVVDPETQLHADHISVTGGRPGVWRKTLNDWDRHRIEAQFGNWLSRHGYVV